LPAIYVDAAYYIALLIVDDNLHDAAVRISENFTDETFVTSDPVLVELLTFVSGLGEHHRSRAVTVIRRLRTDASTEIVPQTRDLFDKGLDLFERRSDKAYSLTDTMSMVICRERGISAVLTHDHHFEQEGFEILL
jgi:predicted nucleic acid-binding protein